MLTTQKSFIEFAFDQS